MSSDSVPVDPGHLGYEEGDIVVDQVQANGPGTPSCAVVLNVTGERADEYPIESLDGLLLSEAALDWPVSACDTYDADGDIAVEVVFIRSLEDARGSSWRFLCPALLSEVVDEEDIPVYTYHGLRLELAEQYAGADERTRY